MKVSGFDPPDTSVSSPKFQIPYPNDSRASGVRRRLGFGTWDSGLTPGLLAAAYLIAHLVSLAPALEDIDSINFALGLRDFSPIEHQPHPPGYPVYIAAGKLSLAAVNVLRPELGPVAAEALALSLWSALAGALALVLAWRVFGLLATDAQDGMRARRVRLWATVLLASCPLFWMTGVRPISDMPGLAIALAAQALLLAGRLGAGAFVAGLALGIRTQTLWLTAPLLGFELLKRRGSTTGRPGISAAMFVAGALCWAVPLVVATGGIEAYLGVLGTQAGEDFAFVDMLWANPTPRRLAFGLMHTLVMPWVTTLLAAVMVTLAVLGGLVLLVRDRRLLSLVLVTFAPYALFHLVFQETVTVRYALPVVAPIAFLAARALALAGSASKFAAAPLAVISLMTAVPGVVAYGRDPHPAFRAIADASRRAEVDRPAMLTSHFEMRRPLRASDPRGLNLVFAPRQTEWMELVRYWAGGGREAVWFLANPRRTDLDLIDPAGRRDVVRYQWRVEARPELSGTRPAGVDWYRLRPPGWFLGEGWSLTAETGGVANATGTGPDRRRIVAYVRRREVPVHLMVGGRYLGTAADGPAVFVMALDGTVIDRWTLTHDAQNFLRFLDLPAGVPGPEDDYARITIRSQAAEGERIVPVAIRQFDIQPAARLIWGFGSGWHEDEYEPSTGRRWRWTSNRAVLPVRGPSEPLRVRIRGESPLEYFDEAPIITVFAGVRQIARLQPSADWELDVVVPADAVASSNGEIAIETTRVFVPAEQGSPDTRQLGLRVFAIEIESTR